ncbi:MAG: glycoside hydrolase family 127 protein, partial [Candidatus Aminicenantes bacterium]|nr:glycoside hydrolase family 127 protein [Candidatus Aminicenantes bacterium]
TVELSLPMPVRRVVAHDTVAADSGRVALQRGPVVFAAEGVDNDGRVFDFFLPDAATLTAEFRSSLLNGVVVIMGDAASASKSAAGKTVVGGRPLLGIPYYAWANRGPGQMLVWLPRTAAAVRPAKSVNMKVD